MWYHHLIQAEIMKRILLTIAHDSVAHQPFRTRIAKISRRILSSCCAVAVIVTRWGVTRVIRVKTEWASEAWRTSALGKIETTWKINRVNDWYIKSEVCQSDVNPLESNICSTLLDSIYFQSHWEDSEHKHSWTSGQYKVDKFEVSVASSFT